MHVKLPSLPLPAPPPPPLPPPHFEGQHHACFDPLQLADSLYLGGWPLSKAMLPRPDCAILDVSNELIRWAAGPGARGGYWWGTVWGNTGAQRTCAQRPGRPLLRQHCCGSPLLRSLPLGC